MSTTPITDHPTPRTAADIRDEIARYEAAIESAKDRAAVTELDRLEGEAAHAAAVADAMLSGGKVPAKPAGLSALQVLDDAQDAALEVLARRCQALRDELSNVESTEAAQRRETLIADLKSSAAAAVDRLIEAMVAAQSVLGRYHAEWAATVVQAEVNGRGTANRFVARFVAAGVPMTSSVDEGSAIAPTADYIKDAVARVLASQEVVL